MKALTIVGATLLVSSFVAVVVVYFAPGGETWRCYCMKPDIYQYLTPFQVWLRNTVGGSPFGCDDPQYCDAGAYIPTISAVGMAIFGAGLGGLLIIVYPSMKAAQLPEATEP